MYEDIPYCGSTPRLIHIPRPGANSLGQVVGLGSISAIGLPPNPCFQGFAAR